MKDMMLVTMNIIKEDMKMTEEDIVKTKEYCIEHNCEDCIFSNELWVDCTEFWDLGEKK